MSNHQHNGTSTVGPTMTNSRFFVWFFVVAVAIGIFAYFLGGTVPRSEAKDGLALNEAGRIPILDHGRVKPLDTLARVSLMIISGKQEYTDLKGDTQPAIRWLFEVMTAPYRQEATKDSPIPGPSADVKAYRIDDEELREFLGLKEQDGTLFSYRELYKKLGETKLDSLIEEGVKIDPDAEGTTPRQKALAMLATQLAGHQRFSIYETPYNIFRIDNDQVLSLMGLEPRKGFRYSFSELLPRLSILFRETERVSAIPRKSRNLYENKVYELREHVELYVGIAQGSAPTLHLVGPAYKGDEFRTLSQAARALQQVDRKDEEMLKAHTPALAWRLMLSAYASNDVKSFNGVVDRYLKLEEMSIPAQTTKAGREAWFNAFAPFYRCSVVYVLLFVVACVAWMWRDPVLDRFVFWALVFVLAIHTWALAERMYLQGRPPVTNLYSSAVFIGWGCVLACLFAEWRAANCIAAAAASLTGFATLLIAHYLGGSGDTLEMMQAVLDTNFWLATHVTTVTIGYSTTFVAGMFGIFFVWQMLVTSVLNSLRQGGPIKFGSLVVFGLAAFSAAIFAVVLGAGILFGLWYLAERDPTVRMIVTGMSGLLLLAGIGFTIYLLSQRVARVKAADANSLPPATRFMESFALTEDRRKTMNWMIYGTVCFALLFSFVGTVLGGIWADQSWGRFWGWDPKENGALLIVIMNALILHARWGGLIKERGMALLAIAGNMITMWSWFGTNQLGVGLHAYGFNNALVLMCRWFWVSQLVLLGIGLLPLRDWRNYVPLPRVMETGTARKEQAQPVIRPGKRNPAGIQPA